MSYKRLLGVHVVLGRESLILPKTAVIPREELEQQLHATPLSGHDICTLLRSEGWNRWELRNAQVAFLPEFGATGDGIQFPGQTLAEVFVLTPSRVRTICAKAKRTQKPPYRPVTLSPHQEKAVCQMIRNGARTGNYVTQREVLNFVEIKFQKTVIYGRLENLLSRGVDEVRRVVVAPQELPRRQVPRSYLDRDLALIKSWIPIVAVELIFNLDETGLSDWEERKAKSVLVPTTVENAALSRRSRNPSSNAPLLPISIRRCLLPVASLFKPRRLVNIPSGDSRRN
jgi:hypothetical protein